jgi:hypothetical protein
MRKSMSKEQEHIKGALTADEVYELNERGCVKGAREHQWSKSTSREQRQMMQPRKGAIADIIKEKIA